MGRKHLFFSLPFSIRGDENDEHFLFCFVFYSSLISNKEKKGKYFSLNLMAEFCVLNVHQLFPLLGRISRDDQKRVYSRQTNLQREHIFKNFNCSSRE